VVSDNFSDLRFEVPQEGSGRRLDQLVAARLPDRSRAAVKRLFVEGRVHVGAAGHRLHRAAKGDRATSGQVVRIDLEGAPSAGADTPAVANPEGALLVVLERKDLVVVDKPAGQPCAPLRPEESGTLANALVARYPEMAVVGFRPSEPGLCHRLDNDTSGLVLAARCRDSFERLTRALRNGQLHKRYLLLCAEQGLPDRGTIDVPLRPHPRNRHRVIPGDPDAPDSRRRGRPAQTAFRTLKRQGGLALVEARVSRALRHQIRAHFASIGHPLAGDRTYHSTTANTLGRHALHASLIRYGGSELVQPFEVRSSLPAELRSLLG
jgi:23S rRNA pseudouridine1911/1915/1917 synthase